MPSFEEALDAEIVALEGDLEQNPDPRLEKLRLLKATRSTYGTPHRHQAVDVSRAAAAPFRNPAPPMPSRRGDPSRQAILDAVVDMLDWVSEPVKTAEIYDRLIDDGHVIGGQQPKSNLSAMLYNSGRFVSHQRRGWTLKTTAQRAAELDAVRDTNLEDLEG
jgi:hypothetical protein